MLYRYRYVYFEYNGILSGLIFLWFVCLIVLVGLIHMLIFVLLRLAR